MRTAKDNSNLPKRYYLCWPKRTSVLGSTKMNVEALVSDGIESGDGRVGLFDQQIIPSIQTVGGRLSGI
jgi:hypothetical protein